jgi:enoyl-CoA hydratase/carnithine racemase
MDFINIERAGDYATIRMTRPEKRNSINNQMLSEFEAALNEVETDPAVRALCLAGEGRHFCAGIDLAEGHRVAATESGKGLSLEAVFHHLEGLAIPTVAAIQGAALAGGCELALHCDMRVAAESARIGMPLARVGLTPPFNFTRKLIEVIGAPQTCQMLFTADAIDGRRAYELGMVNEVVPDAQLEAAVKALMAKIAANAPLSLRAMKATIRRCMSAAFDADHDDINAMVAVVGKSQDAREGSRAFLEKRKPAWKGE